MSKQLTISEVKLLIENAINSIKNMFKVLLDKNTDKDTKRATLLSYWLKDYSKYITDEDDFDSSKLVRFKRGSIVQVEFGYRIGRELGGRHYAVVIDNKNDFRSDIITVVPLMSLKNSYKKNRYTFELNKGLYEMFTENLAKRMCEIEEKTMTIKDENDEMVERYAKGVISLEDYKLFSSIKNNALNNLGIELAIYSKHIKQIEKLKFGTVINAGQVITISKQRIINPKMNTDSLYGIRLASTDLDRLNDTLKNLYIYMNKS